MCPFCEHPLYDCAQNNIFGQLLFDFVQFLDLWVFDKKKNGKLFFKFAVFFRD